LSNFHVKSVRYGSSYIGWNLKKRFSLHSLKDGKNDAECDEERVLHADKDILEDQILPPPKEFT